MYIKIETKNRLYEWDSEWYIQDLKNKKNDLLCKIFGHKLLKVDEIFDINNNKIKLKEEEQYDVCTRCPYGNVLIA